jgi:tetratricopeptide (TPR) repeat protein
MLAFSWNLKTMAPRLVRFSVLASVLLLSCGGLPSLRQADFPANCGKGQPVEELLKRGNAHRDLMLRETPPPHFDPEQWTESRKIYGTRARACYRLVLDTQRDNGYALLNTGFTYMVESTFPELTPELRDHALVTATNYVQQALAAQQSDAQHYYYLGEIAARRGQCDKALRIFNALVTGHWSYSHLYAWMGYCLELRGNSKEAKGYYQKAVDLSNPVGIAEWARSRVE